MIQESDGLWRVLGNVSGCPLADDVEAVARGLELRLQNDGEFVLERCSEGSTVRVVAGFEDGTLVTWRHSRLILLNVQVDETCISPCGSVERRGDVSFVQLELCPNGKFEARPMRFSDHFVTPFSDDVRQMTEEALAAAVTMG